jgi:outer membrane receptor protein involved in Fe transport
MACALLVSASPSMAEGAAASAPVEPAPERPAPVEPGAAGARSEPVVTVSASRVELPIGDVPAPVTVLDRADIERSSAATVDELLRTVPGVSLFRRTSSLSAHPTAQGVSLRGVGPSGAGRALVLVDGIPAGDPFGGWVYWGRIPLTAVERIEVLRGGGSSVWGNAALGGVIDIRLRGVDRDSASVVVEGGTRATGHAAAVATRRIGRLGLGLDADWWRTGGYQPLAEGDRGAVDTRVDSRHGNLGARVAWDLGDDVTWEARARWFEEDRDNGTRRTSNSTETLELRSGLGWRGLGGGDLRADLFWIDQSFASRFSSVSDDRDQETPALDQFDVPSRAVGAGLLWSRGLGAAHLLSLGVDALWTDGATHEDYRWLGDSFERRRVAGTEQLLAGAFVQDLWEFSPAWDLSAALRVDSWTTDEGRRTEMLRADGTVTRDDRYDDRDRVLLSPKFGAVWHASSTLDLRASVYRGFRSPTTNELFRPFRVGNDITEANPALDPETLTGIDVGAGWQGRHVTLELGGYWNRLEDPVANVTIDDGGGGVVDPCGFVPAGGSCRQRRNLDDARVAGVEASLVVAVGGGLRTTLRYLWSDSEITGASESPELQGNRLAQVPAHQVVARLDWAAPWRVDAWVEAAWMDEQYEDDRNTRRLDDFFVVDVGLARPLWHGAEIFVHGRNVLGERAEVGVSGDGLVSRGPGATVTAGVRVSEWTGS